MNLSKLLLWVALALPAGVLFLVSLLSDDPDIWAWLPHPLAQVSVALLISTLLASPLVLLFRDAEPPRWLKRNRRALGVASFCYGALHVALHTIRWLSADPVVFLFPKTYLTAGLIGFVIMVPLAATSNNAAVRSMGPRWKSLQRWSYPATFLVYVHWAAIDDWKTPGTAIVVFMPLFLLETWRIGYWSVRARARRIKN